MLEQKAEKHKTEISLLQGRLQDAEEKVKGQYESVVPGIFFRLRRPIPIVIIIMILIIIIIIIIIIFISYKD